MTAIHGIRAVIYDIADKPYFLIVHSKETNEWRFIEAEIDDGENTAQESMRVIKEITHLKASEAVSLKVAVPRGEVNQEVFLIRCNMNSHIIMDPKYDTYLWCSRETVENKIINGANRQLFERAVGIIKKN